MELAYIREFVELAKSCNYLEASDRLFISQSTLSRHIKALEEELGVTLFDRSTRKVKLSGAAQVFLPYAEKIAELGEQGNAALAEYAKASSGTIAVGAIPSMALYHITDALSEFTASHQYFSLNLIEGDTRELVQMLQDGMLDFAYIRDVHGQDAMWNQFHKIQLDSDSLAAVISVNHPLAAWDSVSLEDLRDERFLMLDKNSFSYSLCLFCCHKAGFEPNVVFTGRHARNLVSVASTGLGVLLLSTRSALNYQIPSVKVLNLVPEVKTQVCLAYNDEAKMTRAARFFLEYVKARMPLEP